MLESTRKYVQVNEERENHQYRLILPFLENYLFSIFFKVQGDVFEYLEDFQHTKRDT